MLNSFDQSEWWRRCGAKGECPWDGDAAAALGDEIVSEARGDAAPRPLPRPQRRAPRLPARGRGEKLEPRRRLMLLPGTLCTRTRAG